MNITYMKDKIKHADKVHKINKSMIMVRKTFISVLVNVKQVSLKKYYT